MEATSVSVNRWGDKEDVVHICNGILLSHREEGNFALYNNLDGLEGIMLSEVSQTKAPCDITYVWSLKNKASGYNKKETVS